LVNPALETCIESLDSPQTSFFEVFFNKGPGELYCRSVWSNYRPAGRMWPATAFSLACRSKS